MDRRPRGLKTSEIMGCDMPLILWPLAVLVVMVILYPPLGVFLLVMIVLKELVTNPRWNWKP